MPDALLADDIFTSPKGIAIVSRRRFNRFWNPLQVVVLLVTPFLV
jgi:hypothetical protein